MSILPETIAQCPRLKVLRLEENSLEISAFTPTILKKSQISLFAVEGNLFDMKSFHHLEGYDEVRSSFQNLSYSPRNVKLLCFGFVSFKLYANLDINDVLSVYLIPSEGLKKLETIW